MKLALPIPIFTVLLLLLVSCASGDGNNDSDAAPVQSSTSVATTTVISPTSSPVPDNSGTTPVATAADPGVSATSTPIVTNTPTTAATALPAPTARPAPTPTPTAFTAEDVLFSGYDINLAEGDFWRFHWEWSDTSCSQGSGCRTTVDQGDYQITLGDSIDSNGVEMFEMTAVGDHDYVDGETTHSFAPKWRYIGVDGHRIVVANTTASALVTLFDAQVGRWAGNSFFAGRFPFDVLIQATGGQLSGGHEFAGWDGVEPGEWHSVRNADSGGECSTFDGRILCPSEEQFDYSQNEYFRPGIGPFGYQYSYAANFSGGGLSSSFSSTEKVALIASSFSGDNVGDFGKPTPVPPTPTAIPSPTPVVLGDPIYGPTNGSLFLDQNSNQIPEFDSGVLLDAGVADVIFENPNVAGKWSHGITFRAARDEQFHAVFINSDGEWGHFARGGSLSAQRTIARSTYDFDTSVGAQNRLTVWFGVVNGANEGIVQINGEDVAVLDLSYTDASEAGDVTVMSGLFLADEISGETTKFYNFTVYAKP